MASILTKTSVALVVLLAALAQFLWVPIQLGLGLGKTIQPLSDFPYKCRQIHDPRIQGCEDMWLSESTRQLFLASSNSLARKEWLPNMGNLNATGRSLDDAVIAMDIDSPEGDSFTYRVLTTPGFDGTAGDGRLHLLGMTGTESEAGINLYLVNNKPSVDATTGELLDQAVVGANSTIEVFATGAGARELKHLHTYADARVATPNNIAPFPAGGKEGTYFTNDHGLEKVGLRFHLSPYIGLGDVSFCNKDGCKRVASRQKFPNGLSWGRDGLLYVPSSVVGGVDVYKILEDHDLQKVDYIPVSYIIDNMAQDGNGDIYAAVFPKALEAIRASRDPSGITATSAVVRIRKEPAGGYSWEKVLEDRDKEVLPGSTVVVHDAKTGRLFLGGVVSPFIAVCDPK